MTSRIFTTTLCAVLLLALATDAHAQRKAGRNAGTFLEIGVGAREAALGSAANTITHSSNQVFWNPAGTALPAGQKASFALSHADWIAGLDYFAAAGGYNLGNSGTVTLGIQAFGLSDIAANRQNGYDDSILQDRVTDNETGATYDYQDVAVSLSYARYFIEALSLGATIKYVGQTIDGVNASAVAFDFGSVYNIGVSGWKIGARISNLGSKMSFYSQDNPLPLIFTVGTSFNAYESQQARLMVAVDAIKPLDSQQLVSGGAELSFYDLLFLRGGYKFNYSGTSDDGTSLRGDIDTTIEGATFGGGIQYGVSGVAVAVDYAYTQMELLENTHRISLRVAL